VSSKHSFLTTQPKTLTHITDSKLLANSTHQQTPATKQQKCQAQ